MKIGISGQLPKLKDELFVELKRAGFDCNDFQLADVEAKPYTLVGDEFTSYLLNIKKSADAAGIEINQVHGPWCNSLSDEVEGGIAKRLHYMKICVDATALLGVKYMVVHPIMPYGTSDKGAPLFVRTTRRCNIDFLRELCDYAAGKGVVICLENMPFTDLSVSTPEQIAGIIDEVGKDNLKMCLDTGHAAIFKEWQPDKALRVYGDYIKVLHVHDNKGKADEHRLPYHGGVINWSAFSKALSEIKFDGVLTLECSPGHTLPHEIYLDMLKCVAKIARHIADAAN
jgi:sugar phosphate isomerase/epimerase